MIPILCILLYLFIGALAYNAMAEYEEIKDIYKRADIETPMKVLAVTTWPLFIFYWWFIYLERGFPFWDKIKLAKWLFIWPFEIQNWIMRELLDPRENTPNKALTDRD